MKIKNKIPASVMAWYVEETFSHSKSTEINNILAAHHLYNQNSMDVEKIPKLTCCHKTITEKTV